MDSEDAHAYFDQYIGRRADYIPMKDIPPYYTDVGYIPIIHPYGGYIHPYYTDVNTLLGAVEFPRPQAGVGGWWWWGDPVNLRNSIITRILFYSEYTFTTNGRDQAQNKISPTPEGYTLGEKENTRRLSLLRM